MKNIQVITPKNAPAKNDVVYFIDFTMFSPFLFIEEPCPLLHAKDIHPQWKVNRIRAGLKDC
jgi:hypothetical protein